MPLRNEGAVGSEQLERTEKERRHRKRYTPSIGDEDVLTREQRLNPTTETMEDPKTPLSQIVRDAPQRNSWDSWDDEHEDESNDRHGAKPETAASPETAAAPPDTPREAFGSPAVQRKEDSDNDSFSLGLEGEGSPLPERKSHDIGAEQVSAPSSHPYLERSEIQQTSAADPGAGMSADQQQESQPAILSEAGGNVAPGATDFQAAEPESTSRQVDSVPAAVSLTPSRSRVKRSEGSKSKRTKSVASNAPKPAPGTDHDSETESRTATMTSHHIDLIQNGDVDAGQQGKHKKKKRKHKWPWSKQSDDTSPRTRRRDWREQRDDENLSDGQEHATASGLHHSTIAESIADSASVMETAAAGPMNTSSRADHAAHQEEPHSLPCKTVNDEEEPRWSSSFIKRQLSFEPVLTTGYIASDYWPARYQQRDLPDRDLIVEVDTCSEAVQDGSRAAVRTFFQALRVIFDVVLTVMIEAMALVLYIARRVLVDMTMLMGDHLLKPLLHTLFHKLISPLVVFATNVGAGLRAAFASFFHIIDPIVDAVHRILSSFRLVEIVHKDGQNQAKTAVGAAGAEHAYAFHGDRRTDDEVPVQMEV